MSILSIFVVSVKRGYYLRRRELFDLLFYRAPSTVVRLFGDSLFFRVVCGIFFLPPPPPPPSPSLFNTVDALVKGNGVASSPCTVICCNTVSAMLKAEPAWTRFKRGGNATIVLPSVYVPVGLHLHVYSLASQLLSRFLPPPAHSPLYNLMVDCDESSVSQTHEVNHKS